MRVALVGAGLIADLRHLPAFRDVGPAAEVVALVDVDPERLGQVASAWDIPGRYTALDRMLVDEDPELVVLCTPPHLHRDQVAAVLESGAWAWCEKPPTLSLAQFDAMVAGERDGGPYAPIVFQQRFGSGARHARELLSSGAVGRPLFAHCDTSWFRDDAYFSESWRGSFTGDGGPLMALGIHQIDLLLMLLGPWQEVAALTASTGRDVETGDVSAAAVRFENGALASVTTSAVSPRQRSHIRVDAERATIEVHFLYDHGNTDWSLTPAPGVDDATAATWANSLPDTRSGHLAQLRAVLADLRAGRRPETSGDGGRGALELVTAVYRSAITGEVTKRGQITPDDPFYHRLDGRPGGAR
ncbi:Gfo/Idh/MocA family oxidoreductase [Jiangella aurantiaca]|uniref:Gfo/Idh/MocA family oxidoreductase n=1 Tax=Jiangella aurantiaca TaxID=2530373 RepID=A0A4R5AQW2_9ACTN|nr:Gfo/Idh/MocA family oxidoreductase [Jiangella aurantiaca]